MGDDITIGVTEIVNNIEVTAQPSDQVIDIDVVDNSDDVTLNITPTVIEININKGSSFARWGTILGNLPDQEDLQNVLNLKADLVGGLVPASQLPSYVDDIVEVVNYAALPVVGETGKIYLTLDNNKIFRWSGSVYIEVAANNAIWGAITGTLSSQTDLQTALDTKALKTITITPNAPLSGGGDLSANRTISISQSNATTDGYLSSTDWSRFNSAVPAGTPTTGDFVFYNGSNLAYKTLLASAPLSFNSGTGTFSISQANTSTNGYLSSTDWNTFNNKQGGLSGTGFVKISGTTISYDNSTYALDSVVVKLTGDQTLSGVKTFTSNLNAAKIVMTNSSIDRSLELTNVGAGQSINVTNASSGTGIQNFNNANSGIGFMSANSITATGNLYQGNFNGVRVFSVGSEGSGYFAKNVGIGTTSPNFSSSGRTVTDINGTSQSMLALSVGGVGKGFLFYTGTDLLLSNETNGSIGFNANGDRRVTILPSGNVGIGTTSPAEILHLQSSQPVIRYTRTGILNWKVGVISGNTFTINNDSTGGDVLNITSGGNVGIGTSSPDGVLTVAKSSPSSYVISSIRNLAGGVGGGVQGTQLNFYGDVGYSINTPTSFIQSSSNDGGSSGQGSLRFGNYNGSTSVECMRITSGGNVGIGTTSPGGKLHVVGEGIFDDGTNGRLTFANASSQNDIYSTTTSFGGWKNLRLSSNELILSSGGTTERMRITSGGTVNVTSLGTGLVYSNAGTLTSTNPSDSRLKDNIVSFNYGLSEILKLRPVSYNWKNDNINQGKQFGFIAQEVQEVMPELVKEFTTTENEKEVVRLGLDKEGIYAALINAIKELEERIKILEK